MSNVNASSDIDGSIVHHDTNACLPTTIFDHSDGGHGGSHQTRSALSEAVVIATAHCGHYIYALLPIVPGSAVWVCLLMASGFLPSEVA